jgi:hypothetical protein
LKGGEKRVTLARKKRILVGRQNKEKKKCMKGVSFFSIDRENKKYK